MPESTCLHIQDHESAPIRVVDIPWISVRIGRAAFCEVRLTDPDLADEACRLYRRGRSWHLVPVKGPRKGKAPILLDGRAVDTSTPLPFDVPFRVGPFCLTLRQDRAVDPDWEMYPGAAPAQKTWSRSNFTSASSGRIAVGRPDLVVESRMIAEPSVKAERLETRSPRAPVTAPPSDAGGAAASLKERWETRWRAAGVELNARAKARAATSEPRGATLEAGFRAVPLKETSFPRTQANPASQGKPPRDPVEFRTTSEKKDFSEGASAPESRREPLLSDAVWLDTAASEQRFEEVWKRAQEGISGNGESPSVNRLDELEGHGAFGCEPEINPSLNGQIEPPLPGSEPQAGRNPTTAQEIPSGILGGTAGCVAPIISVPNASPSPASGTGSVRRAADEDDSEDFTQFDDDFEFPPVVPAAEVTETIGDQPDVAGPVIAETRPPRSTGPGAGPASEANAPKGDDSWYEMPVMVARRREALRKSSAGRSSSASSAPPVRSGVDGIDADLPRRESLSGRERRDADGRPDDGLARSRSPKPARRRTAKPAVAASPPPEQPWPSAKAILAAQPSASASTAATARTSKARAHNVPTVVVEPAQWSVPTWLGALPALAFVLSIGSAGTILSWRWAGDSYAASQMTARLFAAERAGQRAPLPDSVVPSSGTWTHSTAQHLAHWAVYMSTSELGKETTSREVKDLLDRALQISPLNPSARLALAQIDTPLDSPTIRHRTLGLSRDVAALSWCARRLMTTGHKDDALKIFAQALTVATRSEASRIAQPVFSTDPNVPRYLLPGEERVQEIVRDVLGKAEWVVTDWLAVLPDNPTTYLATARLLKEQGRSEADSLLDHVLAHHIQGDEGTPDDVLTLAARGEAFAQKAQWKESERLYRTAIELVDDDTTRRSWWFNLADIELRLDDEIERQSALRAALAINISDDITRRASDIQRGTRERPLARSSNPRAN